MENFYNLTIEGDLLHIYEICNGDQIMQQDCRPLSDVVGLKLDIGTFYEESVRLRQERDEALALVGALRGACEIYDYAERIKVEWTRQSNGFPPTGEWGRVYLDTVAYAEKAAHGQAATALALATAIREAADA